MMDAVPQLASVWSGKNLSIIYSMWLTSVTLEQSWLGAVKLRDYPSTTTA